MPFKTALWDDSDPDYAPGINYAKGYAFWRPSKSYVEQGYPPKATRLPGRKGDHLHRIRAAECRRLARDMVRAFADDAGPDVGTWAWVIDLWKQDPYSSYHSVKQNTRENYDYLLETWLKVLGTLPIQELTYDQIGQIRIAMDAKQRSASYKRKMFGIMKTLAKYAAGPLKQREARDVVQDLSLIRIPSDPKRQVAPDYSFIRAIVDEADARGLFAFATGILIQWTFMLRAVDVRGQWFDGERAGGICFGGKRWQDGLTWDMFDDDLTRFTKVVSKTAKSLPEPLEFAIDSDELRGRLRLLSNDTLPKGPVIVSEVHRRPYTKYSWSQAFRRIRDDLEYPKNIWMMDTRAGAITEGKSLVDNPYLLRDAAQHMNVSTTDGYARKRSESIATVVKLRRKS